MNPDCRKLRIIGLNGANLAQTIVKSTAIEIV